MTTVTAAGWPANNDAGSIFMAEPDFEPGDAGELVAVEQHE